MVAEEMEVRLLGPVEASVDGRPVALGVGKRRALLAMLALHEGSTVSAERLVDGLWGEQPPASAHKMVQMYVSQLRRALAAAGDGARVVTRGQGYELRLGQGDVDVRRFERLVASGAAREALGLWRGPALDDVAGEPFAAAEIRRLDELRLAALEQAVDADLAAGRHREVLGELEALVQEDPLRERVHWLRMLALYRSGRQAEALEAYRDARRTLVDEIGVEPGPELRRLHEEILRQDPALDPPERLELPAELDVGTPLAGREPDLDWLREQWRSAHAGTGRLVLIAGPSGIGKTRLAAELAVEVHRDGGAVRYGSGVAAPDAALTGLGSARSARRPTLLVLDDVDRAGGAVLAAVAELAHDLAARPALVLATAAEPLEVGARATRSLAPLDAAGVRAVAERYATGRRRAEVPVERLLEASGGLPRRLHRLAAQWARADAEERVGADAQRAAAERAGWREAEADLAGSVAELQAVRERTESRAGDRVVACPFKGLASFDVEDASYFFGRERLVAEMVARVAGEPILGVVGPSGSGKSSALRAGLLAELAKGVLPGSERWPLRLLRPGEHPLQALEQAAANDPRPGRPILAVDQFEEVFTTCRDEAEREAFVGALVAATRHPSRPAVLLIAVRADYYGRCAVYPELARLLAGNHVLVGPMRRDELRRAVELPARRAGLEIEPELVDALIADIDGEPGALPLLSTSLLELWQRRDGRRLRLTAYDQTGGVRGAVARLAERAYGRLAAERRPLARRLLLRLAGEGEGTGVVGRRVPLSELDPEPEEAVADVLGVLAGERLVTIGDGVVEVAHEALLHEWPRLRGWLEEDAEGRRVHRRLGAAASEWDAAGRDAGELYRGARLAAALDWSAAHDAELSATEGAFLNASRTAGDRANRRLRIVLAAVASLLVLTAIAGAIALNERAGARDQALAADAQRLGAQALVENRLDRALLLARQGVALDDSVQTRGNLLSALLKSPAAIGVLNGGGKPLISLDTSPDGRRMAFLDEDGTLTTLDPRTRRPLAPPYPALGHDLSAWHAFDDVRFSPDGSRIAVGGMAPAILDARTHRTLAGLAIKSDLVVYSVRYSPDGRTLFALMAWGAPGLNPATMLQRFDAFSGRALGPERIVSRRLVFVNLLVTPDGRLVTTSSSDAATIYDARTLRPLAHLPVRAERAALARDGHTMLAGAGDGSVRFVDLDTRKVDATSVSHGAAVTAAAFTADGSRAVTAGADGRAIVWDVARRTAVETLGAHAGAITALALPGDGATLYTAGVDSRILAWDLDGTRRLGRPFAVPAAPRADLAPAWALSPDGRRLVVGDRDGRVTVIDAGTLRSLAGPFRVLPRGPVTGVGFLPRGGGLIAVGGNGFLVIVDPASGTTVKRLPGHAGWVAAPSFSRDGRVMATASDDGVVQAWALPSGRRIGARVDHYPNGYDLTGASLSPDGRTMAVTTSGAIDIVDVATDRRRTAFSGDETVSEPARFTADGRFVVAGSSEGWARLWSPATGRPVGRVLGGHAGAVTQSAVSHDGRTLATGSTDGTVELWDLRTERPIGAALPGVPNRAVSAAFTPDGGALFAVTGGRRAFRWDVRPANWARRACQVAGRRLTRAEWEEALPRRAYAPACSE